MIRRTFGSLASVLALVLLVGLPTTAAAQIAVTQSVSGPSITLSWAAVPGADSYTVQAGLAPGAYLVNLPAGATGLGPITAPAVGTYHMQVVALQGGNPVAVSGDFTVAVSSLVVPPATPTNVEAFVYCGTVLLRWQPGAGGTPAGYAIQVTGPVSAKIPTGGTSLAASNPPVGDYAYSVVAVASNGAQSAPSAPVAFSVGAGGAATVPTPVLSQSVFGTYVSLRWASVPAATGYTMTALQNGVPVLSQTVPSSVTSVSRFGVGFGTYEFRVAASTSCGLQSPTAATTFVVDASTAKLTPRAADPPGPTPPNYLPLPNRLSVVQDLARQYPSEFRNSCGDHRFLYRVVARLRQEDKRWGLNWKRAIVGSMSEDVITYNFGSEADEGTRQVHVVDIIGGHCGPNPNPVWIDQTVLFSTGAMWTLVPFLQAGYNP